jgi:Cu/Ag efflux protein CusF
MTMMFRVDAETLARVKKGDQITGQLGRDENKKWFLSDVKVAAKE